MRVRSLAALVAAVAVSVTLAACGATDSTAPTNSAAVTKTAADAANANLLTTLLGSPKNVTPALRDTPLAKSITVSKQIGILGGTIAIPEAGLAVIVPPLAIPATKTISITALAGDTLAYEFEPHGLKFGLPLVMTQSLAKTNAGGSLLGLLNVKVGYFPDPKHITSVTELLGVQVNLLNQTAITTLWHFSGYIIAVGRDNDSF
ncbi:MAG TPA: hypothetical protein VGM82_22340 [Gemmatimonadaceae bacterium]|jgi:hypothetical protein